MYCKGNCKAKAKGAANIKVKAAKGAAAAKKGVTWKVTAKEDETPTPEDVHATGIELDQKEASVQVGSTVTLNAILTPADSTDTVSWGSSDETVATVNGGVVAGLKEGTATITAVVGEYSASCVVTVTKATGAISKVEATGAKILTVTFEKDVTYTKADFTVKKGSSEKTIDTVEVSGNTAVVTLNSKLTEGEYTVAVDGSEGTVTVQNEKISGYKTIGTTLAKVSNTAATVAAPLPTGSILLLEIMLQRLLSRL